MEFDKGGIQSGAAPDMNPASGRKNKRLNIDSWQYAGYDKWQDGDIQVTCHKSANPRSSILLSILYTLFVIIIFLYIIIIYSICCKSNTLK